MSSWLYDPLSDENTGLANRDHLRQCDDELDDPSTMGVQSHCLMLLGLINCFGVMLAMKRLAALQVIEHC